MKQRSLRAAIMAVAMTAGLVAAAVPAWADLDAGIGSVVKAPTGDSDGDSTNDTSSTEDDDTNDGGTKNNVSDDNDNAHPSRKDRSVESGGSGNQGNAGSDPDDDGRGPDRTNGGPDKPNGSGGDDLADQDGNNGCGNDDDFEDDNEGWCGGKPKPANDESCTRGKGHGWECSPGSVASGGGSSTCPNKHMGGDDNGGGANRSGAYDSTCDGSASGNGNGTGGRGKPCAGCVGNADDKNPPGQLPDGSDANKGYECDENSGVGKTNPAHSGCMPEAAANADVLGRTDHACPAGTVNAGEAMANPNECDDTSVLGAIVRRAGPLGVAGKKVASAVGAALPFTGAGDLVAFLALAGLLLAAGVTMLRKKNEVGTEA